MSCCCCATRRSGIPYFESIDLKIDYDVVNAAKGSLDLHRGAIAGGGFRTQVALYDQRVLRGPRDRDVPRQRSLLPPARERRPPRDDRSSPSRCRPSHRRLGGAARRDAQAPAAALGARARATRAQRATAEVPATPEQPQHVLRLRPRRRRAGLFRQHLGRASRRHSDAGARCRGCRMRSGLRCRRAAEATASRPTRSR